MPRTRSPRRTICSMASTLHGVVAASCSAFRYARASLTPALHNEPREACDRFGNRELAALVPGQRVPVNAELGGEFDEREADGASQCS